MLMLRFEFENQALLLALVLLVGWLVVNLGVTAWRITGWVFDAQGRRRAAARRRAVEAELDAEYLLPLPAGLPALDGAAVGRVARLAGVADAAGVDGWAEESQRLSGALSVSPDREAA